jgi:hypothetical protein
VLVYGVVSILVHFYSFAGCVSEGGREGGREGVAFPSGRSNAASGLVAPECLLIGFDVRGVLLHLWQLEFAY